MNRSLKLLALLGNLLLPLGVFLLAEPAPAVQLADGTVYFVQVPRLVRATTTVRPIRAIGASYLFTIILPEKAGEPLQRVEIQLQQGGEMPQYNLPASEVLMGTETGPRLTRTLTVEDASQTVSVVLDPPLAPGNTVTISLRPWRNPGLPGVYLFGVTAFPPGTKAHGQFLGYGRLTFTGHRL